MDAIPELQRIGPKLEHWVEWQSTPSLPLLCHWPNPLPLENLLFPVAEKNHPAKFDFQS